MLGTNFNNTDVLGIRYEPKYMMGRYYGTRNIANASGDAIFVRDAMDQDYIDPLEEMIKILKQRLKNKNKFIDRCKYNVGIYSHKSWALVTDYGRSLPSVLGLAFGLIFCSGRFDHADFLIRFNDRG